MKPISNSKAKYLRKTHSEIPVVTTMKQATRARAKTLYTIDTDEVDNILDEYNQTVEKIVSQYGEFEEKVKVEEIKKIKENNKYIDKTYIVTYFEKVWYGNNSERTVLAKQEIKRVLKK